MVKISVIIPVYNKKNFLNRCIESVLNSTFKELEIVCVEDGSTDGSIELLQKIQKNNSNVNVFANAKNQGAAYSRNIGITYARGKYIMFLDADDYLDANALEIYYEAMENVQAQGCFIRFKICSDCLSTEAGIIHEYQGIYSGLDLLNRFVDNNENFLYACNAMWQRKFLLENNIRFKNAKIGEGGLFILEGLLKAERVIYSNFAGYYYMINATSTSKGKNALQESAIGQIKQIIFMIKNLKVNTENKEIAHFLDWYIKKNIGGITNLCINENQYVEKGFLKQEDVVLLSLIRGDYLEKKLQIEDGILSIIQQKKKMYLYGAGYETFSAIKYCHQMGIEIVKIFVTSKDNNPDNIYGFHVYEFDKKLIDDFNIPFVITVHKKHQGAITQILRENGILNITNV